MPCRSVLPGWHFLAKAKLDFEVADNNFMPGSRSVADVLDMAPQP